MRKQMDPIILGDPDQGGFRGYNSCGSNNDLAWGQSPLCYNYLVSNTGLEKRKGSAKDNATQIGSSVGTTGLHRHYNGSAYKTFAKIGTRVYDVQATGESNYVIGPTEAGDAANQLSAWSILGANAGNTNAGVLYRKLTNSGMTRTVDVYKNSDGVAGNKVATGSATGETVNTIETLVDELYADYIAHCALVAGVHLAADTVNNDPTALAANTLTAIMATLNSLKAKQNAHDTESGTYHPLTGTASQITAADATDFDSAIALANALKTALNAHCALTCAIYTLLSELRLDYIAHCALTGAHLVADTVNNNPTAIASNSLADMITSANSWKTKYNAHDTESGVYHSAAGTAHQVAAADATDTATLITLVNAEKVAYEAHRVDNVAHGAIDSTNVIASANAASEAHLAVDATNIVSSVIGTTTIVITLSAANSSGVSGWVTVNYYATDDTTLSANTLTFGVLAAGDEIEFESWAGYFFFADGISLYGGTTGNASTVTWLDENGASTSGWTLLPTPAALALYKEHLWWFDKNSSRVGFTPRGYHNRVFEDTIDASNYGSWAVCDEDDGQYLMALVRMPLADGLMAFKRQKSFIITGDYDSSSDTLDVSPGPPCGAYSQKAVIVCPDGFIRWYGPDGIWQYRADTGPICISYNKPARLNILAELAQISSANRTKCCMGYDSERNYLLFFYPYGSSATYNNRGMAFDTVKMEWMPIRSWNVARLVGYEDGTVHAGWSNAGYTKKLFYGYNDDPAAISCYYETKYYGRPQIEQVLDSIKGRITAGRIFTFGWRSDPGTNVSGSVSFAYGTAPTVLGDRDNPAGTGFTLGDKTAPGGGTTLSDRDARVVADFARRVLAGQKFREMTFIFSESSISAHSLDFIECRIYPRRLVV